MKECAKEVGTFSHNVLFREHIFFEVREKECSCDMSSKRCFKDMFMQNVINIIINFPPCICLRLLFCRRGRNNVVTICTYVMRMLL